MKGTWPDRSKNKDWVNKGSKPIFGVGLCPWLCEQKNVGVKGTLENEWEPSQFSLASGLTKNALWFIRWCVISTRFQLPNAHFSIILESSKAIKTENAKRQWKHGQKNMSAVWDGQGIFVEFNEFWCRNQQSQLRSKLLVLCGHRPRSQSLSRQSSGIVVWDLMMSETQILKFCILHLYCLVLLMHLCSD